MRAALSVPRRVLSTPRVLHCRPWISSFRGVVASRAIRANSTTSANGGQRQDSSSSFNSSPNSSSWTATRTLLVSALAAGIGYGFASVGQESQQVIKKPQYGSPKDFEKVQSLTLDFDSEHILTKTGNR